MLAAGAVAVAMVERDYHPDRRYANAIRLTSPVAWWRFDEMEGTRLRDRSGRRRMATYHGPVGLGVVGPLSNHIDTAASFDGSRAYASVGDRFDFPGRTPFSLEAWVRPRRQPTAFSRILSKEVMRPGGGGRQGYDLYVDNQQGFGFERFRDGRGQSVVSGRPPVFDRYTHVVASFDGRTMALFLDGRLVSSRRQRPALRIRPLRTPLVIGRLWPVRTAFFAGFLDEVAIYDRALTPRLVRSHYLAAQ